MNNNLEEVRTNALRLSKEDLAHKLGVTLSVYEKWELDSVRQNKIDLDVLMKVSQVTGISLDSLVNASKSRVEFKIGDNWNSVASFKKSLLQYFRDNIQFLTKEEDYGFSSKLLELKQMVVHMARKPRVALVGRSDVGKSTLINSLMDSDILPQEWTPTTSIVMIVKHMDDRPVYCKDKVMIFKSDKDDSLWDDTRLCEENYTKSLCIAQGDYSLLREYGARQGTKYNKTSASSAVVFIDSPILKNCDFLDLPGYGTSDREEDDSLLSCIKEIDVLIYLSVANGFMRGEDIAWLQQEMVNLAPITLNNKELKPLSNLFVVASQAQTISNGSYAPLKTILEKAAERFESTLAPSYWVKMGQSVSLQDFRARFFTYSTDQESLRADFEKDLHHLLTLLPKLILVNMKKVVSEYLGKLDTELKASINQYKKILCDREEQRKAYRKASDEAPEKLNEIEVQKAKIVHLIETEYSRISFDNFAGTYNKILAKDFIVKLIEQNNWKNKKEDQKALCSKISNLLNEAYASSVEKPSEDLTKRINNLLENFERYLSKGPIGELSVNGGFDVKGTFAGGLAGIAAYGALAMWAASLGNLGAYILIAKGVSLLAAMGISVGGTAAAISTISLIGGPIVIAVGLAALLALVGRWIFGSSWQERLTKNIIKEYDKQNGLAKFKDAIENYWRDTKIAFIKAMDSMRDGYIEYLRNLGDMTNTDDTQIDAHLQSENEKIAFISNIIKQINKV